MDEVLSGQENLQYNLAFLFRWNFVFEVTIWIRWYSWSLQECSSETFGKLNILYRLNEKETFGKICMKQLIFSAHESLVVKYNVTVLEHPPYSSDLAIETYY